MYVTHLEGQQHVVVLVNEVVTVVHVITAVWLYWERDVDDLPWSQVEDVFGSSLPRENSVLAVLLRNWQAEETAICTKISTVNSYLQAKLVQQS